MDRFSSELLHVELHPPPGLRSVQVADAEFLRVETKYAAPFSSVLVHTEPDYRSHYPHGAITILIRPQPGAPQLGAADGANIAGDAAPANATMESHAFPASAAMTIQQLCSTICHLAKQHLGRRDVEWPPKSIAELFPIHGDNEQAAERDGSGSADEPSMIPRHHSGADFARAFSAREGDEGSSTTAAAARGGRHVYRDGSIWSGAASIAVDSAEATVLNAVSGNALLAAHLEKIETGMRVATNNDAGSRVTIDTACVGMELQVTICVPMNAVRSVLLRRGELMTAAIFSEMMASYGLQVQEQILFKFTFDPTQYGRGSKGVAVNVGQPSNFASSAFPGAVGQLRRIVQRFVAASHLVLAAASTAGDAAAPAADADPVALRRAARDRCVIELFRAGYCAADVDEAIRAAIEEAAAAPAPAPVVASPPAKNNNNSAGKKGAAAAAPAPAAPKVVDITVNADALIAATRQQLTKYQCFRHTATGCDATQSGLFLAAIMTWITRLKMLPHFCAICDRIHEIAGVGAATVARSGRAAAAASSASATAPSSLPQAVASCCQREGCRMRYNDLDVGRDIVSGYAVTTGVIDLLVHAVRAAAMGRAKHGLKPWPLLVDSAGNVVVNGESEHKLPLLQQILTNFPNMCDIVKAGSSLGGGLTALRQHHELAPAMLKWISTSCRSTLVRVPKVQQLAFLNTPHQFRILTQSAEHNERFEALKQKHGSMLTWHGAPFDVVFSILNTGLRNMSHDKAGGMFHGNACGGRGGIYQSAAYLSTSLGYSGGACHNPATVPAREDDLITPDKNGGGYGGISAIFLAECVDHDFTSKNESIVVQPNDDHVVLRGLFIYTPPHVSPPGQNEINTINLQNAEMREKFRRFVDTR